MRLIRLHCCLGGYYVEPLQEFLAVVTTCDMFPMVLQFTRQQEARDHVMQNQQGLRQVRFEACLVYPFAVRRLCNTCLSLLRQE